MDTTKIIAVLFDFDGVIMDTETQYTVFWDEQGHKYLGEEDFGRCIKGQTLTQIYEKYFSDKSEAQEEITARLNLFEKAMSYKYIPGVEAFIADLRRHGAKIAVVTSSNEDKMQNVYNAHPEFERRDVRPFQACSRLFPVGYGSIQCDSRKHLRI